MIRLLQAAAFTLCILPKLAFGGEIQWSQTSEGLMMGLSVSEPFVTLTLRNVGSAKMSINSHVMSAQGDEHLDWFEMRLRSSGGEQRVMRFLDSREGMVPVVVHLESGAQFSHTVNVVEWAKKPMNSGVALVPGVYTLQAFYEVATPLLAEARVWGGRVMSAEVPFGVADEKGLVPQPPEKSPYIYDGDLLAE